MKHATYEAIEMIELNLKQFKEYDQRLEFYKKNADIDDAINEDIGFFHKAHKFILEELEEDHREMTKKKDLFNEHFAEVVSVAHTKIATDSVIAKSIKFSKSMRSEGFIDEHE